jgi:hypothetical protein
LLFLLHETVNSVVDGTQVNKHEEEGEQTAEDLSESIGDDLVARQRHVHHCYTGAVYAGFHLED